MYQQKMYKYKRDLTENEFSIIIAVWMVIEIAVASIALIH